MTSQERNAEDARLAAMEHITALFPGDESTLRSRIEGACSELDREMGVRERCFPNWIKEGKVSKIDATDRFLRMKYAQEMCHILLDIIGESPRMTNDDVPF